MTTTSAPEITIEDAMRALVKFTKDLKSLTATLQKAATAAADIDPAAVGFFHRLRMVLLDMSHQIATLELPPKFCQPTSRVLRCSTASRPKFA
jgi:hypothetical protein